MSRQEEVRVAGGPVLVNSKIYRMPCIICGKCRHTNYYRPDLLKCANCGFVFAPLDETVDLRSIYTNAYFNGDEYMDYKNDRSVIERNFLGRIREIRQMFGEHAITSALEIGCAYGFFARQFTAMFKRARYYGIDIAEEAVTYAKVNLRQNCENTDYLILPPPQPPYSDVFLWDVIEHLPNPFGVIEKISREIVLGGRIHITTGDIDSLVARYQKAQWRLIHPPTHLSYFSVKTLTMLLRKHGFRVKSISYPPIWRSVRQMFYSLFILNRKDNVTLGKLYSWIPEYLCIPINTFDIMYMVAEKTCDTYGKENA